MNWPAPPLVFQETPDYWISPDRCATAPRVTVVIPCFRAADTLMRAVYSALSQSLRDIEVIVVDDMSTDDSWDLITTLLPRDRRIRALRNKQNGGKSIGMNRAIAVARGRWLAVLDADDWYDRERLAVLVSAAEAQNVDMIADNQSFYDAGAHKLVGTAWPAGAAVWTLSLDDFLIGSHAYETFNFGMLKPVIRMDFIRASGLTYEVKARHGQDFFYLLQFFMRGGKAAVCDAPHYYYTQPFGTASRCWSHQSRKRYDFQTAYDVNRTYLQNAAAIVTQAQLRKLEARTRRLHNLEHYYAAKDMLAAGRTALALKHALRHPNIIGYALHRLLTKALGARMTPNVTKIAARRRGRNVAATARPASLPDISCADHSTR